MPLKIRLRRLHPATTFYLNLSLVISLVIVAIYLGIYLRNNSLLMDAVKQQATSYFDLIVRARRWNAGFGGVYVEKKPGIEANRYLREVGVEPDVPTVDGRVFTLKNQALMTRELSAIFSEHNGVQFHITSMQLLNPANAPDSFEIEALKKFSEGEQEFFGIEGSAAGPRFRYMAPLWVEESCQKCHVRFNYKVGDIRGGISVSIPFKAVADKMALNRNALIGLSILSITLLLGSAYLMLHQMSMKIEEAHRAVREASITDELTGLRNRRYLLSRLGEELERAKREGRMIGALMLDIDHFKLVNDTYGHLFGDFVLQQVAGVFAGMLRDYDIVGRYGGEEFIVVATSRTAPDLLRLAERIRQSIGLLDLHQDGVSAHVTASLGMTVSTGEDTVETLIKRADLALYQAKNEGRNRTVSL